MQYQYNMKNGVMRIKNFVPLFFTITFTVVVICVPIILMICLFVAALGNSITEEVYFTLYTNNNPNEGIPLTVNSQLDATIKRDIPWKFFVHGWTTSPWVSPWFDISRDNYFRRGEYNIVYVDWSKPANQSYVLSVLNAKGSGQYFADFIINLIKNDVPITRIHLLGHSLGSHMVGHAGKAIKEKLNTKLTRITATDPAGPLFDSPLLVPKGKRLDQDDAVFVDVIHTDAGNYGMEHSIGHIDFWPNGGKRFQPGCENDADENCSHARSVYFYGESIISNQFIGRQAESWEDFLEGKYSSEVRAVFGEDLDTKLRGVFYFKTNSIPPFAQGEQTLKIVS